MSKPETLNQAIQLGKENYKKVKDIFSENDHIRFAVAEFIWDQFSDKSSEDEPFDMRVLEILQKITR